MPGTIVVGLDHPRTERPVLGLAKHLATAIGARLSLIHVLSDHSPELDGRPWAAEEAERSMEVLEHLRADLAADLTVTVDVRVGDVATELLAAAAEADDPMILVGARGLGPVRAWLLGSVSRRLLETSAVPVLVASSPSLADAGSSMAQHILVPFDGSPAAEEALRVAARIAASSGGSLTLIRVEVVGWAFAPVDACAMNNAFAELSHESREMLRRAAHTVPSSVPVAEISTWGTSAARTIMTTVNEGWYDLIVIGSSPRRRLRHMLVGSVTRELLGHSPVPVLAVHADRPSGETASCTVSPARDQVRTGGVASAAGGDAALVGRASPGHWPADR